MKWKSLVISYFIFLYSYVCLLVRTIYTLRKEPLEEALKNNWGSKISFFYEEFIRTALELADILQFESPFFKPCRPRDSQIEDFLFKFVCNNYIIKVEVGIFSFLFFWFVASSFYFPFSI